MVIAADVEAIPNAIIEAHRRYSRHTPSESIWSTRLFQFQMLRNCAVPRASHAAVDLYSQLMSCSTTQYQCTGPDSSGNYQEIATMNGQTLGTPTAPSQVQCTACPHSCGRRRMDETKVFELSVRKGDLDCFEYHTNSTGERGTYCPDQKPYQKSRRRRRRLRPQEEPKSTFASAVETVQAAVRDPAMHSKLPAVCQGVLKKRPQPKNLEETWVMQGCFAHVSMARKHPEMVKSMTTTRSRTYS